VKWNDQSHSRPEFSSEWYVLGNGPWDWRALDGSGTADGGSSSSSSADIIGGRRAGASWHADVAAGQPLHAELSCYPGTNRTKELISTTDAAASFNTIQAGVTAATRTLFKGELDGRKFAPLRTGACTVHALAGYPTSMWGRGTARVEDLPCRNNAHASQLPAHLLAVVVVVGGGGKKKTPNKTTTVSIPPPPHYNSLYLFPITHPTPAIITNNTPWTHMTSNTTWTHITNNTAWLHYNK
jgi:hypothetical protein